MYRIQDHAQDSGEYLLVMPNLRSLALHNTRVEYASEDEFRTCFSAFREILTYLSLETFATSFSAFVTVVDYFLISQPSSFVHSNWSPTRDRSHVCLVRFGGRYTSTFKTISRSSWIDSPS